MNSGGIAKRGNPADGKCKDGADALTAQVCFAVEMKQKNPKILEIFKANGNTPVCEAYEQAMAETNNLNAARSAAVDCYLDAAMPDNKPSVEKIAAICKTSNGKSYYAEPVASPVKTDTNIFEEPAFNTAFKRGKKQSLYDEASFNTAFAAKAKRQGR